MSFLLSPYFSLAILKGLFSEKCRLLGYAKEVRIILRIPNKSAFQERLVFIDFSGSLLSNFTTSGWGHLFFTHIYLMSKAKLTLMRFFSCSLHSQLTFLCYVTDFRFYFLVIETFYYVVEFQKTMLLIFLIHRALFVLNMPEITSKHHKID